MSPKRAAELTHNMYELEYTLPASNDDWVSQRTSQEKWGTGYEQGYRDALNSKLKSTCPLF